MELTLNRLGKGKLDTDKSTVGELIVDGTKYFTIEDDYDVQKTPDKTRIPAGRYEIKLRLEGRLYESYKIRFPDMHKGMLWLQNVPNYQYIYIHCGNSALDTSGCIIVGSKKVSDNYIIGSEAAYKLIYPKVLEGLRQGKVFITIND
jgi:hypothetical protein